MVERKRSATGRPAGAKKPVVVDLVPGDDGKVVPVVKAEVVEGEPVDAEDAEEAAEAETEQDEDADEAELALADVDPATDEELDAIAREIGRKTPATATTALARRDPMGQY